MAACAPRAGGTQLLRGQQQQQQQQQHAPRCRVPQPCQKQLAGCSAAACVAAAWLTVPQRSVWRQRGTRLRAAWAPSSHVEWAPSSRMAWAPTGPQEQGVGDRRSGGAEDSSEAATWVFAYACHMSRGALQRLDIEVESQEPAVVVDPSIKIYFKSRGGLATLEANADAPPRFPGPAPPGAPPRVHGVLYRLARSSDLRKLQRQQGFVLQEVEVETYDGRLTAVAQCLVAGPLSRLPQEVVPPETHMQALRCGAAEIGLSPMWQAWLSSIESVPSTGLGAEYWATPSRFVSYLYLLVALTIVGAALAQHM